ncbi:MAG: beta-ketoacyl-ACP synthase II [Planctomycetota bacterium]
MRRAVVTGVGCVTPVGMNAADTWESLLANRSGLSSIEHFDTTDFPATIGGEIKNFDPSQYIDARVARRQDRWVNFGLVAAVEAMADSGLVVDDAIAERAAVITGSGIGGLLETEIQHKRLLEMGPKRVSPFLIPKIMLNAMSGQLSMIYNLKGANFATASACASAGHAIGLALRAIQYDEADIVLTGGAEATITPVGMSGFGNMKALSTRNDDPEAASRPFDRDRDGFVMGEGAGVLVIEEYEFAKARGAKIYCELAGVGMTGDAHHITQPAPGAEGAQRAMRLALRDAKADLTDVSYVNAHGTSTPINDPNESLAIEAVFGDHAKKLAVSSTKSMIGHLLGGSAAVESVVCALSIQHSVVHQTKNCDHPDVDCNLDYVQSGPRDLAIDIAISNSLGFGGHNLCLAFRNLKD